MKWRQRISALLAGAMILVPVGGIFAEQPAEEMTEELTAVEKEPEQENQGEGLEADPQEPTQSSAMPAGESMHTEPGLVQEVPEEVVLAEVSPAQAVEEDCAALTLAGISKVPPLENNVILDDLSLPTVGKNGSVIQWSSDTPGVLSSAGAVKRGAADTDVALTAVVSMGGEQREKSFQLTIPARRNAVNGMPVSGNILKTDDFSDGVLDERIKVQTGADIGTVTEEDGVLKLTRTKATNDNAVYIRYPNDRAEGNFVTEFTINKLNQNQKMMIRSWGNGDLFRVDWNEDGHIWAYFADEKGGSGYAHDMGRFETEKTAKFTIFYRLEDGAVDLWINNRLVCGGCYLNTPGTYLNGVTVYNVSADALPNAITADDYKYYLPIKEMPDRERVEQDLERLTYDLLFKPYEGIDGYVAENLDLPNAGYHGSDIVWESSDESLISLDGAVHRPETGHGAVTLKMTVISGEVREERQFALRILNQNVETDALPLVEKMIYENDFSDSSLPPNITFSDTDGGKSSIKDGKLLMEQPAGGYCYTRIFFSPDNQPLKGMICVEYTLEQTGWGQWNQVFEKGGAWSDYLRAFYYGDGNTYLRYLNEDGSQGQYYGNYPGKYHLRILFDTEEDRYSAWIDGKLAVQNVRANNTTSAGEGIMSMQFATGNRTYDCTVAMDDLKVYYAIPPSYSVAAADYRWLTDSRIRTAPYVADNIIDQDLNLVTQGRYGSSITWRSSRPDIIAEDGRVTLPESEAGMPEVTLTAVVSAYGFSFEKSFTVRVLRSFQTAEERLSAELEDLSYELITKENPNSITGYLLPISNGFYGHPISWNSSNPLVITNAGRVMRPRWDMGDQEVTLTASVSENGITKSKDFQFTVKADAEYTDPQYMSDEEFFGKYTGGAWGMEGKLDYSRDDLKAVEAAVMENDYVLAKEELLKHMQNRTDPMSVKPASAREAGWANMKISDIYSLQMTKYYQGTGKVTAPEYERVIIPVKAETVTKGGANTYGIISRYNEASTAVIASRDNPDKSLHPRLELTVNGQARVYEAEADATIRAGEYADASYGTEPELTVKMSGEFLGNETSRALLRFNFSDILETDAVTDAALVLHAKTEAQYSCEKELIVIYDPTNTWTEDSVCWNGLKGYVYNYNGLPGRNDWNAPKGADAEYLYQSARFFGWDILTTEYLYTKDEKYAYYMISDMMDFIWDKGEMTYTTASNWGGQNIRGGYPRTLDTSVRLQNQIPSLLALMQSRYMTPDICTVIMKNMWDMADSLTRSKTSTGNWIQHENKGILHGGLSFPEFTKSDEWFGHALGRLEALIYENHFDDGSYIEGTGGYSQSAYGDFVELKETLLNSGRDVSDAYNEMLHKAGYYNMLLNGPDGSALQYGDQQGGSSYGDRRPNLANWFQDDELGYISSFGRRGKQPAWTSKLFPDSKLSIMRSNWTANALFSFTHVRGGGQHSHADDNTMTVMAYRRNLLVDPGIMTYTESDPNRIWGKSTRAHNTVEINNSSQSIGAAGKGSAGTGTIHDWVSNDTYDFISQSSKAYHGFDHRRTITFVKSGFWIVSDLIDPDNKTAENSYKQSWHMLPNAGLVGDDAAKTISSNFKSGANIIVASADGDARIQEEMGLHDYSYGQIAESKFAYAAKDDVKGKATFDTVLLPYKNPGGAEIQVSRLDMGTSTAEATALRFDSVIDGTKENVQYMLDYAFDQKEERSFGGYQTTAKLALVRSAGGNIKEVILNQSAGISGADGSMLVDLGGVYSDFSYEIAGDTLKVETSDDNADAEKIKLMVENEIKNVTLNGNDIAFHREDGVITLSNQSADRPSGGSGGGGIIDRKPSQGGSGSSGGGSTGTETQPNENTWKNPFRDVNAEDWFCDAVQYVNENGFMKGVSDTEFAPEDDITRAMFVTVLYRAEKEPEAPENGFRDVEKGSYYEKAVAWAAASGIVNGVSEDAFAPDKQITREQMAAILYRYAGFKGYDTSVSGGREYTDRGMISDYAEEAVSWTAERGIMSGNPDGSFAPRDNSTRAQAAAVIMRLLKK